MPEQLVLHETTCFTEAAFETFTAQLNEFNAQIPEPAAVSSKEVQKATKMGDKKRDEAAAKLEALKGRDSFLPAKLALSIIVAKMNSYTQAESLDKNLMGTIAKAWANGTLGGIDALVMLALVDDIAVTSAALGNEDAIKYLYELEKIKAKKAAETAKKAAEAAKIIADAEKKAAELKAKNQPPPPKA
jgi:hypothetical protein